MTGMGGIRSAFAAALGVADDASPPDAAADAGQGLAATTADASLLALVDRLTDLLERSDLDELEVRAGGTGLALRKAGTRRLSEATGGPAAEPGPDGGAVASRDPAMAAARPASAEESGDASTAGGVAQDGPGQPVVAPLTGIFYASPSPSAPAFVAVGQEIVVGQVIGLIEAMKLFNEIKSDRAGRVTRVVAASGALVKAKQPLIEVAPL